MILEWILFVASIISGLLVLLGRKKQLAEGQSIWVDYGRSLFPVVLIVFALRSFVVEPFRIPSGSMLPTLHIGDFILVNKLSYGIRLPIIYKKVIPTGEPKRGDVMVFRFPPEPKVNYIKRLVGMPGDHVEVRDQRVFINGELLETQVEDAAFSDVVAGGGRNVSLLSEQLGEVKHDILIRNRIGGHKGFNATIPEGQYFVLGDNRDNSRDSRWWGFVPEENLVGRAFFIWMSWDSVSGGGIELGANW